MASTQSRVLIDGERVVDSIKMAARVAYAEGWYPTVNGAYKRIAVAVKGVDHRTFGHTFENADKKAVD